MDDHIKTLTQSQLYDKYGPFVRKIIRLRFKWAYSTNHYIRIRRCIDRDDLDQEGYLALLNAQDKFNPNREVKFKTYVYAVVYQRCLRYIQQNISPITVKKDKANCKKQALAAACNLFSELKMTKDGESEKSIGELAEFSSDNWITEIEEEENREWIKAKIEKLKKLMPPKEYKILVKKSNGENF